MSWTRNELKARGSKALQKNYWKTCFITALILFLSFGTIFSAIMDFITEMPSAIQDIYDGLIHSDRELNMQLIAVIITLTFGLLVLDILAKIVLNIFVKNPVDVGACVFMKKALRDDNSAMVGDLAYCYDHHYLYYVKNLLIVNLITFAWTLLLLVPGVIRRYRYRLVPYLLTDQAELTAAEAMSLSSQLMDGHKWNAFLLDLSFLAWHLAGILSFGILEVFFVQPYQALTNAALYDVLHQSQQQDSQ